MSMLLQMRVLHFSTVLWLNRKVGVKVAGGSKSLNGLHADEKGNETALLTSTLFFANKPRSSQSVEFSHQPHSHRGSP
jgi:hypothetical protein